MLIIRLQRAGKKNAASYRIVVAEKTAHVSKKVHEVLGVYNPSKKHFSVKSPERVQYWISQNIQASPTIHNLLVEKGLLKADKVKAYRVVKKEEPKKEEPKAESEQTQSTPDTSAGETEQKTEPNAESVEESNKENSAESTDAAAGNAEGDTNTAA